MSHKKATKVPPIIFTIELEWLANSVKISDQIGPAYLKLLKILFIFVKYSFFLQEIVLFLLEWVRCVK